MEQIEAPSSKALAGDLWRIMGGRWIGLIFAILSVADAIVDHFGSKDAQSWWSVHGHYTPERPLWLLIVALVVLNIGTFVGAVKLLRSYGDRYGIEGKNKAFARRWFLEDLLAEGVHLRAEMIRIAEAKDEARYATVRPKALTWTQQIDRLRRGEDKDMQAVFERTKPVALPFSVLGSQGYDIVPYMEDLCARLAATIDALPAQKKAA